MVHAVEESVFMARLFGRPYTYDMDSSLSAQLTDKKRWFPVEGQLLQGTVSVDGIQERGPVFELKFKNIRINAKLDKSLFSPPVIPIKFAPPFR